MKITKTNLPPAVYKLTYELRGQIFEQIIKQAELAVRNHVFKRVFDSGSVARDQLRRSIKSQTRKSVN
jgi:hypothetical protein